MTPPLRSAAARLCGLALLAWSACGGGDDSGNPPDAGSCSVAINVTPAAPQAFATIEATATVLDGSGFVTVAWTVSGPAGPVSSMPANADGTAIQFVADEAGPYDIQAQAMAGGWSCTLGSTTVNVTASDAQRKDLRLRYTPLAGQPAPAQDDPLVVSVYGGSPMTLPDRTLDSGTLVDALLTGPDGPLPAYLRLDPLGGPTGAHPLELFAAADGAYAARLPGGVYDLLVVPDDGAIAPLRVGAQTVADLGAGYVVDSGDVVTGTLFAPDGTTPVAGALVAVAADDLPAVLATTAADGTFQAAVRVAGGAPLAITVVPPVLSGYAQLALTADAGVTVAPGAQLTLRLADAPTVLLSASVTSDDGLPFAGVPVTFVASSFAAAGTLSVDGAAPVAVASAARATITSDASGAFTVALPQAAYTVILAPPTIAAGQALTSTTLDLTTGAPMTPPVFVTAGVTPYTLFVTDPDGNAVDAAHVTAVARGIAGVGLGATAFGETDASGTLDLPLSADVSYDLIVDPPRGAGVARARLDVAGGGAAGTLVLPAALPVTGTLRFAAGTGQPGVRVAAYCVTCDPGEDPTQPLAETVTGAGGAFLLELPDPGVAP